MCNIFNVIPNKYFVLCLLLERRRKISLCWYIKAVDARSCSTAMIFYFNYTYQGQYDSLSYKYDYRITIHEWELYEGQPFARHALCVHDDQETTIIGKLIQRQAFFRVFLPILPANPKLFHFYLPLPPMSFPMNSFTFGLRMTAIYVPCLKSWSLNMPITRNIHRTS